jgi:hypothetical protein
MSTGRKADLPSRPRISAVILLDGVPFLFYRGQDRILDLAL